MEPIVAYSQTYRTRTPGRQLEIDEYLRRNINHSGISRIATHGTVPVEVANRDERISYAEWLRWVQSQGSGIGLLSMEAPAPIKPLQ